MKYITIDGDDIGRRITSHYLRNNRRGLEKLSLNLKTATENMSKKLINHGFEIIFCAADGVAASTDLKIDCELVFEEINLLSPENITFSAGVGSSLREAYMALISAKSNGKNCLHYYTDLEANLLET